MSKSIFIVGTDTGIGKTFLASEIMRTLILHNYKACYYKPIQSGIDEETTLTDTEVVKKKSSTRQTLKEMNSYTFNESIAPHLASQREGALIDKNMILDRYEQLKKDYDYVIVEGAGGVIVPINNNYYMYDLIKDMNISAVVVSDAGVGTINHTCLTIEFLKKSKISINAIVINNYSGAFYEDDNIKMIENFTKEKVKATIQYEQKLNKDIVLNLFEP